MGAVAVLLAALISGAASWFFSHGYTLYYGDAEAHLNVARRFLDSRTPGYSQIGTTWLPLPHMLMLPFVTQDALWHSGSAGIFASAIAFVIAGLCWFSVLRRSLGLAAAATGTTLFALNPNVLYLSSIPMTETLFFAALFGALASLLWLRDSGSSFALLMCSLCALAGTLLRYDGWFLLPFVAGAVLLWGGPRRIAYAIVFCLIAGAGPIYWLVHNYLYYGDPLEFYRGEYSSKAINPDGPGYHDWSKAARFYRSAVELCLGLPLIWMGLAGIGAAFYRRALVPLILLSPAPLFYVWSIYTGNVPIHTPQLWYGSYYNTRYGLAMMPLVAFGGAALVSVIPSRARVLALLVVVLAAIAPWVAYPREDNWITWKESQMNSLARREWIDEGATFLRAEYHGGGIASGFGDLTAIFRRAGIPIREVLHEGNHPAFDAILARPELFLHEEWVVAFAGDKLASAVEKVGRYGRHYTLVRVIMVKNAPVIHIYRRG